MFRSNTPGEHALRGEILSPFRKCRKASSVNRVSEIVRAMKRVSHPGHTEKSAIDIHQAAESTIVVSRNEWKYVADLTTNGVGFAFIYPRISVGRVRGSTAQEE
jgi:hypothetical protein